METNTCIGCPQKEYVEIHGGNGGNGGDGGAGGKAGSIFGVKADVGSPGKTANATNIPVNYH